ncbi:MAG TPA: amidase [Ktedonobacteraceae bacterium]|nr:amidase [Ktedonobacteraceae bacterium]
MSNEKFPSLEATVESFHTALQNNEVTSESLVQWYIERIQELDSNGPKLHAIVTMNPNALAEARAQDDYYAKHKTFKGSLHGVPVLVKDQAETKNIATAFGSKVFEHYVPEEDAELVKRLRDAGAVILAKTTMCDFAAGWFSFSSLTDHTKNPYAPEREAGGSSAGTGAGVAANLGLIGIGEDTGGSIRIPASFNNLFGLRPTTGLVSRSGFPPLIHFQDTPGPIARTVRDVAKLLDVIAGYDTKDPFTAATCYTRDIGNYEALLGNAGVKSFRVGILSNVFGPDDDPDAAPVNEVIFRAVELLKKHGATIVDGLTLPDVKQWIQGTSLYGRQSKQDITNFLSRRPGAPAKTFMEIYNNKAFHPMNDLFHDIANGPEDPATDGDYYRMRIRQEEFRRTILNLMAANQVDFLLFPTVQVLPPTREDLYSQKWSSLEFPTNTVIASQSGLPAMSIPAGFSSDDLPVGFELVGRPFAESQLLQFAYAYEKHAQPRKAPQFSAMSATNRR